MNKEILFSNFPEIGSSKISLKKITENDVQCIFDIYRNSQVFALANQLPRTKKESVQKMIISFENEFVKQKAIRWGICFSNELENVVGVIEAVNFKQEISMVDVNFYLNETYWGNSIASEALRIAVEFLFSYAELNRIQSEVMLQNSNAKKVLFENSFVKEGTIRQANLWKGKGLVDIDLFSKIKKDYV